MRTTTSLLILVLAGLGLAGCQTGAIVTGEDAAYGVDADAVQGRWNNLEHDMTKSQVLDILGTPTEIEYGEFVEYWRYQYLDGRVGQAKFAKPGLDLFFGLEEWTAP